MMTIKFGTSGWRGIIAADFTFANARRVTRAICEYMRTIDSVKDASVIVGYDTRFLGERFAAEAAKEIAGYDFQAVLCDSPVPTPTVAHAILVRKAAGGIIFTASHNPPEYNGMKFSTADGAPAMPEITRRIEELLNLQKDDSQLHAQTGEREGVQPELFDPRPGYLADLQTKVRFDVIGRAAGRYAYDPLWGTGRRFRHRGRRRYFHYG